MEFSWIQQENTSIMEMGEQNYDPNHKNTSLNYRNNTIEKRDNWVEFDTDPKTLTFLRKVVAMKKSQTALQEIRGRNSEKPSPLFF